MSRTGDPLRLVSERRPASGTDDREETGMKYLLLIYQNHSAFEALTQDELDQVFRDVDELMAELTASGEFVDGQGLAHPSNAKSVRVRDGVPAVTDGPFIEAKEQLAGFTIVECETPERAVEIAARWPDARYWGLEVRPLMGGSGTEM
jgi:hypothetical protein